MANVTPIQNSSILNNYRPISLLSCLGKVFERRVFKYFFNYLRVRDHTLIRIYKSGFTPGDCTTNQLVSMYTEICTALENQNDIQLIRRDLAKSLYGRGYVIFRTRLIKHILTKIFLFTGSRII